MDAFVISLPAGPDAQPPCVASRMERLAQAGLAQAEAQMGTPAARSGRASTAQADAWVAIGLTTLTNTAELRVQAGAPEASPLDLIVRLRAEEGPGFNDHLSGGFAVVLINRQTGAVECYRDHFGIIPLYYCVRDGVLSCGSDMRLVLHLSNLPIADDPVRIADFVAGEDVDRERTAIAGLHRLPAAHRLLWQDGQPHLSAYWTWAQPPLIAAETAADALRERLFAATGGCLNGQDAPGAMLSGGLDSSTLAGIAADIAHTHGQPPLPTLSFVYPEGDPQNETAFIDAANDAFRTAPHKIQVTAPPRLSEMSDLIEEQMDLFLGFGLPKSRQIYRIAAAHGLTALIDGHGGDEVISHGYDRLIELAAQRRWLRLLIEMRGTARIYGSALWGPYVLYIARHGGLAERGILRRVLMRIARQLLPGKAAAGSTAVDLMAPALRDAIDPDTRYGDVPGPTTRTDRLNAEQIAHLKILSGPRMESAFETLHRSAVRQGVLPLYPFFDRGVVALCLSVPSEAKMRDGQTRWVLRAAMRGLLPEPIRTRATKAAFDDEFRATVLEYLETEGDAAFDGLAQYVDLAKAEDLRARALSRDDSDVAALRLCWRLAILRQWRVALAQWQALQERGELV
ncbi:MAG: asparagine synthase-related protein [Pseudomonadota bacterium]